MKEDELTKDGTMYIIIQKLYTLMPYLCTSCQRISLGHNEDNEYLCGVANIHEYFHSHLYFSSNGPRHMIVMAILNERTRT